jgi:hypothetical protein
MVVRGDRQLCVQASDYFVSIDLIVAVCCISAGKLTSGII